MPKRTDISSILVVGSGPIVIGQACEFDYSGTQACRVLREEGYRVILVNSNPATIMTDPEFADATYIEPIQPDFLEKVIAAERPDALLATLGGQTALNAAVALHERGVLAKYGVELIGASFEAIQKGEDREKFKEIVQALDIPGANPEVARSRICHSMDEVWAAAASTSSIEWQMWLRATSGLVPGMSRAWTISLNFSRSSPFWMASNEAPISSTPYFASTPRSCRATAAFSAVCPPRVASRASGRSAAITFSRKSGWIGSM